MYFEVPPGARTMGAAGGQTDIRTIATLKDGQEIRIDITTMSPARFRTYLRKILLREDLAEESRALIERALSSTPEEVEPPDPEPPNYSRKRKKKK